MLSIRVLQLVNQERNAYGIRYNDYHRYRSHCANKVHRLRRSLKMTHGKGREFKKQPPPTLENVKEGHLHLLLFEAERAWAYAQEMILSAVANDDGKVRHHAVARFRRAQSWSNQLLTHASGLFSESRLAVSHFIEIWVYVLIIRGQFNRNRDEFHDALDNLAVARQLLDTLGQQSNNSRDQALATMFADEIGPEIRHSAHELGHPRAYDVDAIVTEIATKQGPVLVSGYLRLIDSLLSERSTTSSDKARGGQKLTELIWEGKPIPIRHPELVDVLLTVQLAAEKLSVGGSNQTQGKSKSRSKVAAYDSVLQALSDAESVARKHVEAKKHEGGGSTSQRDVHFIHSYITYELLSRRTQRDLILVDALVNTSTETKDTEGPVDGRLYPAVIKLLDTVLQSMNQMRNLSVVDESTNMSTAIEERISFTQAKRCLYLALTYAIIKKYAETLALTQRGHLHLREARSMSTGGQMSAATAFYPLSERDLAELETILDENELKFKKEWFTFNGGAISSAPGHHKKPLFFDIALNYVELPMDRLLARAGKQPLPTSETAPTTKTKAEVEVELLEQAPVPAPATQFTKGGLGGLLGGWWGRS